LDILKEKKTIRRQYLEARKALPRETVDGLSKTICHNIRYHIPHDFQTILFYVPINNEVDVLPLAKELYVEKRNILFPRLINDRIVPYIINDLEFDFVMGAYNIPEPDTQPYDGKIDLILVPGVAFDCRGYRLGYGRGYFDQFLFGTEFTEAWGVAYNMQIAPGVPHTEHDYILDSLITETGITLCQTGVEHE